MYHLSDRDPPINFSFWKWIAYLRLLKDVGLRSVLAGLPRLIYLRFNVVTVARIQTVVDHFRMPLHDSASRAEAKAGVQAVFDRYKKLAAERRTKGLPEVCDFAQ